MKIFFSWSGLLSKHTANIVREWFERTIFPGTELGIFISENISVGARWHQFIERQLSEATLGIVFVTRENQNAPWPMFESGAIVGGHEGRPLYPILIDLDFKIFDSPLKFYQCVQLSDRERWVELALRIGALAGPSIHPNHLRSHVESCLDSFIASIQEEIRRVDSDYREDDFQIFPQRIKKIKKGKVFIGSPMASIDESAYRETRENMLLLKEAIISYCQLSDVYYPGETIAHRKNFDGKQKALAEDFKVLKECEYYVFYYPDRVASSILIEIGYAIGLCKKTLIFTRDRGNLPFMLQEVDKAISNIKIYEFESFEEVLETVERNGPELFDPTFD